MPNIGFKDRTVAELLKQMALERRTRPHVATRIEQDAYPFGDGGLEIVGITLTEDMGATTAGEASCTVQPTWDPATETYTGSSTSQVAVDSKGVFAAAVSGAEGLAIRRQGNGRIVYEVIQLDCGPAA